MLDSKAPSSEGELHLKHSRGGMIDIEFIVQYLILKHANDVPGLTTFTDNIRLLDGLEASNIISVQQADTLREGYKLLRDCHHHQTLEGSTKFNDQGKLVHVTEAITDIWNSYLT